MCFLLVFKHHPRNSTLFPSRPLQIQRGGWRELRFTCSRSMHRRYVIELLQGYPYDMMTESKIASTTHFSTVILKANGHLLHAACSMRTIVPDWLSVCFCLSGYCGWFWVLIAIQSYSSLRHGSRRMVWMDRAPEYNCQTPLRIQSL
jgi:hypothetical protein